MKIKVISYNKDKNEHSVEFLSGNPKPYRTRVDFFVGCAIEVPTDPYIEEKYDEIAYGLIGKEFIMSLDAWSEQHQMWLPDKKHITEINL